MGVERGGLRNDEMSDAKNDSILFTITDWWMENEHFSHLLHVHGDSAARESLDVIFAAFRGLAEENVVAPFFSAEELRARIARIAEPLGLTGYYGPKKCGPDPLDQVRDVSLSREVGS
jgi:hypothetical protein